VRSCPRDLDERHEDDPGEHASDHLRPPTRHLQTSHSASSLGTRAILGKASAKTGLDLSVADQVDVQWQAPDPSSSTWDEKIEWNCQP
jgi:hypothetical protein